MSWSWAVHMTRATIRALPRPRFTRRGGRKHAEDPGRPLVRVRATRPHARRVRHGRASLRASAITTLLFLGALAVLTLVVLQLLGSFRGLAG